jgi:antitoxin MazE
MVPKTLKVIKVGNSLGVRLPREVLQRYQIMSEVELVQTADGVLLRPPQSSKLSLADSFHEMASDHVAIREALDLEGTLSDGLQNEEFGFLG